MAIINGNSTGTPFGIQGPPGPIGKGEKGDKGDQGLPGTGGGGRATRADLKASDDHLTAATVFTSGRDTADDGGGGKWYWDAASTASEDWRTIHPTSVSGAGRWHLSPKPYIDVRWFGAKADGTTDDSDAINAAISALDPYKGGVVKLAFGIHKCLSTIRIARGVILEGAGGGSGDSSFYPATVLRFPASVTGIDIRPVGNFNNEDGDGGKKAVVRNVQIEASAKNTSSVHGTWSEGTNTITLDSAGDFVDGQSIRLHGAGFVSAIAALSGSVSLGGSAITLNSESAGISGLYIGQYIDLGTAFTRTKITNITGGGLTITVADAAANDETDAVISYYDDVFFKIVSGGTTTTLTVNTTYTAGTSVTGTELTHADHGISMSAPAVIVDCTVKGFQGNGVHVRGDHSDVEGPLSNSGSNANGWAVDRGVFTGSLFGIFTTGDDANAGICVGASVDGNALFGVNDDSHLGNTYVGCQVSGGYGYRSRSNANNRSVFLGCYTEVGTFSGLGLGTFVFGGTMPSTNGGTSLVSGAITNAEFRDTIPGQPSVIYSIKNGDGSLTWYKLTAGGAQHAFLASTSGGATPAMVLDTTSTITSGNLLHIKNNAADRFKIDYFGDLRIREGAWAWTDDATGAFISFEDGVIGIGAASAQSSKRFLFTLEKMYPEVTKTHRVGDNGKLLQSVWSQWLATGVGADLTSGSTVTPTDGFHKVSGTSTIQTITVPFTGFTGWVYFHASGAWSTNTAGNIGAAVTVASDEVIGFFYDGSKWWPVPLGSGAGTVTSVSAGTGMSFTTITGSGSVAIDTTVVATTSNTLEMASKTLTAQVVKTGLTASGSASNDFSGSTGTFKTSTGANTLGGDVTVTAGKKLLADQVTGTAGAPSVGSFHANLGTVTGISVTGTTEGGEIVFTTGTVGAAISAGAIFTLTFASSFAFPNGCSAIIYPANDNASFELNQFIANEYSWMETSTTGFTWKKTQATQTFVNTTQYKYKYIVKGF